MYGSTTMAIVRRRCRRETHRHLAGDVQLEVGYWYLHCAKLLAPHRAKLLAPSLCQTGSGTSSAAASAWVVHLRQGNPGDRHRLHCSRQRRSVRHFLGPDRFFRSDLTVSQALDSRSSHPQPSRSQPQLSRSAHPQPGPGCAENYYDLSVLPGDVITRTVTASSTSSH